MAVEMVTTMNKFMAVEMDTTMTKSTEVAMDKIMGIITVRDTVKDTVMDMVTITVVDMIIIIITVIVSVNHILLAYAQVTLKQLQSNGIIKDNKLIMNHR